MTSGTSLRRTKASLIYWRTGNLRAVQLLLGQPISKSTVRYLSIEGDDGRAFIAASPLTQKTEKLQSGFCYSPIPVIPRNAGWDIGPLMTGACEGDASGAGIRLSNAGICGAGF